MKNPQVQFSVAMRYAPMAMVTCKTNGKAMGTAAMRMERAVSKVPDGKKHQGPDGATRVSLQIAVAV